jgi:nucleoside phosphorylase
MIVCAGKNENFSFAYPIGVGLVNAAVKLTELFIEKKPQKILFVGSGGSYGNLKEFDVALSNSAANMEIGFLEGFSYSPILEQINVIDANVSRGTFAKAVVNSSNFITSNSAQSKLFLDRGFDMENMEFFAVLKVAEYFGVPSLGLFCITNMCDENARKDFIKNHSKAKTILENIVLSDFKEYI